MWRGKSSYAITTSVRVVGAWPKNCRADRETVEVSNYRAGTSKLSQYRSLEQSYTVLTHGMLEQIEKLLRYRTIEQGLQNCHNIGHSSKVILYLSIWKLSYTRADRETVEISNYRAGTSKLSQYRSLEHCPMWRGNSSYAITTSVRVVGAWPKNCRAYRAGTWKLSRYRTIE